MSLSNLLSHFIGVYYSCIWIFIPNIKNRNTDIPTQIIECILLKKYYLLLIKIILNIIYRVINILENFESKGSIISFLLFENWNKILNFLLVTLSNWLLKIIINVLILLVFSITSNINLLFVLFLLKNIIVSVTMITTFKSIRMCQTKLLIKHYSTTTLFIHILISIFSLHMLSWEVTLLKLKI